MPDQPNEVILGVDTHSEQHVAALIDGVGRFLGSLEFQPNSREYRRLLVWCSAHGYLRRAGVEATGSYGLSLARFLAAESIFVIEVNRPNRQQRRRRGKSDPTDAEAAARAVLSGEAKAIPKSRDGVVEAIRALQVARSSAVKARTQAGNQLRALLVTAPEILAVPLRRLRLDHLIVRCGAFRLQSKYVPMEVTRGALRHLARRWLYLDSEVKELDQQLQELIKLAAPRLLAEPGVGPGSAARLLVAAGDNPQRLGSDAAFAALCGASPVEASSGKVKRHRVNRGGNRQGNNALWTIAANRRRHHPETRHYVERRTREGLSDKEILRCLMRHLARRLFRLLLIDLSQCTEAAAA
jgi:transposase